MFEPILNDCMVEFRNVAAAVAEGWSARLRRQKEQKKCVFRLPF